MDGYILRDKQEQLTLPAAAADKLLRSGQGDAALLYLALRRFGRGVTPEELERALPISRLRIDAAEKALQDLGLLPRPAHEAPPAPADEEISTWMQPPRPEPDDELDMADVHKFMVNHKQKESEDEL